jgi:(p)ppGpp synthase/HD superfamily hydrolase
MYANIARATIFATKAHQCQVRKYSGRPYIYHPMRVAHSAVMLEAPDHVVAAAWLHDVVEDCGITIDEVEKSFGPDVAMLVLELTNPSKGSDLPRSERKAMDRAHIAKASYWAKVLKLLDRLDNVQEMTGCGDKFMGVYAAESRLLSDAILASEPDGNIHSMAGTIHLLVDELRKVILQAELDHAGIG